MVIKNYSVVSEYYDTWMYCDETPPAITGSGWKHLGGTDFQYTPGKELTPYLSFSGIIPGRQYLITGYIEIMDALPTRNSIRLFLGTDDVVVHSINNYDSGTPLVVIGSSGSVNDLFQLQAWSSDTITRFVVRDLTIQLVPEDSSIEALVDEDMKYLLDVDNTLLVSDIQGINNGH